MYLLNVHTRKLEYFIGTQVPLYAILSHTWGDDEITFQEIHDADVEKRRGYEKVKMTCEAAARRRLDYVWIDTCCIDKSSSAELSEAINSMFRFYEDAALCFVHLRDVQSSGQDVKRNWSFSFSKSRWFKRGWTLQELIAPSVVIFMDQQWREIGTKSTLAEYLVSTTRIPTGVLLGEDLHRFSVAQKMSWASDRETTRIEDRAYSLLGIFGVNMPLLYGEEHKAFRRLQEEIIKTNDDYTIFVWRGSNSNFSGPFAPSPDAFYDSSNVVMDPELLDLNEPISLNNKGVFMWTRILERSSTPPSVFAVLPCKPEGLDQRLALYLEPVSKLLQQYRRVDHQNLESISSEKYNGLSVQKICIQLGHQRKAAPRMLAEAANKGNTQLVKLMLEEGANPDHSYYEGQSVLANAILSGDEQVVRLFLEYYGANPKLSRPGQPALSTIADETGNVTIKRLLFGQDTDSSRAAASLIIEAAAKGLKNMVTLLLSHGADPNQTDSAYRTPLSEAIIHRQLKVASLLLDLGADIEHAANAEGESMLVIALRRGDVSTADILLDLGANVDSRDVTTASTPLISAAKFGDAGRVTLLLERGATLEATDEAGNTPLCWAAHSGFVPVIEKLLEKGANIEHATKTGATPLILSRRFGNGRGPAVALIEKGANVDAKDDTGYSPIIYAIEAYGWDLINLLLTNGADPHLEHKYLPLGEQALARLLRWASQEAQEWPWRVDETALEVIQTFISAGADVNFADDEGNAPLHWAAQWGEESIVRMLLKQGASPNRENRKGKIPWELASPHYSKRAAKALLAPGVHQKKELEGDEDEGQSRKRRKH